MTMAISLEESQLVGRGTEIKKVTELMSDNEGQQLEVISVWGMGGLGKTTLARDVYQEISSKFEKRACVTIMRPFILEELFRSLVIQLGAETSEKNNVVGSFGSTKTSPLMMSLAELTKELAKLIKGKSSLIILDDVLYTAEWDLIVQRLPEMAGGSRVLVTTREENIAKLCSGKKEYIYKLEALKEDDARDLFTKKVCIQYKLFY
jgi:predicted AAA+ superfamily ATPase